MIGLKFKQVIITINLNLDTLPWEQIKIVFKICYKFSQYKMWADYISNTLEIFYSLFPLHSVHTWGEKE